MPTPIELRNEAGVLVKQARAIFEKAESEKRGMNQEEQDQFNQMHNDADALITRAQNAERQTVADAAFNERDSAVGKESDLGGEKQSNSDKRKAECRDALAHYLRTGEVRAVLQQDSDVGGGMFATSETLMTEIMKNADLQMPLRSKCTTMTAKRGTTLGLPYLTGDVSPFEFGAGELTTAAEDTGIAFGKREFKPRDMKRKIIKVSKALLENSSVGIEALIGQRAGYAYAQGLGSACMTGDGSVGPLGLFVASSDGIPTTRDVVTGSATGITADALINIQGALRAPYQPGAQWLMHPNMLTKIRLLKDGNQQYVFVPGLQLGQASTILGKPYVLDEQTPSTYTNGNYCLIYGDLRYYWIADATNWSVQRLVEVYAANGQIGLLFDGMAADGCPVLPEAFVRGKCSA